MFLMAFFCTILLYFTLFYVILLYWLVTKTKVKHRYLYFAQNHLDKTHVLRYSCKKEEQKGEKPLRTQAKKKGRAAKPTKHHCTPQ